MGYKVTKFLSLYKNHKMVNNFYSLQLNFSFIKDYRLSLEERQFIHCMSKKYLKKSNLFVRYNNYCLISLNTHSVYKYVKMSRHFFKKLTLDGLLPGWSLSSW